MRTFFLLSPLFLILVYLNLDSNKQKVRKEFDYVPNKETAVKIAEAIWLPIYGVEIYDYKPFVAKLKANNVWVVEGTLRKEYNAGGVPYIEIQKRDCKILKVTHGK